MLNWYLFIFSFLIVFNCNAFTRWTRLFSNRVVNRCIDQTNKHVKRNFSYTRDSMNVFKNYNDDAIIRPGVYRHYKGKFYRVVRIVTCSETLQPLVLYQALYDNYGFWVRPLEMFTGDVEIDGRCMKRFTFINDQA